MMPACETCGLQFPSPHLEEREGERRHVFLDRVTWPPIVKAQERIRPHASRHCLHFGVTRAQHSREPRGLFLAPPSFTRLFEMPVASYNFQCPFPVDLLLQPAEGFIHRLAFFQFNLSQKLFTSSPKPFEQQRLWGGAPLRFAQKPARSISGCQTRKGQRPGRGCILALLHARNGATESLPGVGRSVLSPPRDFGQFSDARPWTPPPPAHEDL